MAILQPNCNSRKVFLEESFENYHFQLRLSTVPGPDLEPKWPFYNQIVIAERLQKAQVQIWSQNGYLTAKL